MAHDSKYSARLKRMRTSLRTTFRALPNEAGWLSTQIRSTTFEAPLRFLISEVERQTTRVSRLTSTRPLFHVIWEEVEENKHTHTHTRTPTNTRKCQWRGSGVIPERLSQSSTQRRQIRGAKCCTTCDLRRSSARNATRESGTRRRLPITRRQSVPRRTIFTLILRSRAD